MKNKFITKAFKTGAEVDQWLESFFVPFEIVGYAATAISDDSAMFGMPSSTIAIIVTIKIQRK